MIQDLATVFGGDSMESRYLRLLGLLDQVESATHNLVDIEAMPPELAVRIAEVKQSAIEAFAEANRKLTLDKIKLSYAPPTSE